MAAIDAQKLARISQNIYVKIEVNKDNLNTNYHLDDPIIYIIFTSGSTGEPKGVQITRDSILDFKEWLETDFKFSNKNI